MIYQSEFTSLQKLTILNAAINIHIIAFCKVFRSLWIRFEVSYYLDDNNVFLTSFITVS